MIQHGQTNNLFLCYMACWQLTMEVFMHVLTFKKRACWFNLSSMFEVSLDTSNICRYWNPSTYKKTWFTSTILVYLRRSICGVSPWNHRLDEPFIQAETGIQQMYDRFSSAINVRNLQLFGPFVLYLPSFHRSNVKHNAQRKWTSQKQWPHRPFKAAAEHGHDCRVHHCKCTCH